MFGTLAAGPPLNLNNKSELHTIDAVAHAPVCFAEMETLVPTASLASLRAWLHADTIVIACARR